jgi:hypothetical protein
VCVFVRVLFELRPRGKNVMQPKIFNTLSEQSFLLFERENCEENNTKTDFSNGGFYETPAELFEHVCWHSCVRFSSSFVCSVFPGGGCHRGCGVRRRERLQSGGTLITPELLWMLLRAHRFHCISSSFPLCLTRSIRPLSWRARVSPTCAMWRRRSCWADCSRKSTRCCVLAEVSSRSTQRLCERIRASFATAFVTSSRL